jgi:acetyl esterase/lipase
LAEVAYGPHERQVLDFWKADSNRPTPLVFVIHGGGWQGGDKSRVVRFVNVEELLAAGISVVSINYRYVSQAGAAGIKPPVQAPLHDAARALQFVRSKAAEWNLDKARIGATGGSAGACSSLWLALHGDLADPNSSDSVARESTRLWCAAVIGAQTTLDPQQMKEWTPNSKYGGHAFRTFRKSSPAATTSCRGSPSIHPMRSSRPMIRPFISCTPPRRPSARNRKTRPTRRTSVSSCRRNVQAPVLRANWSILVRPMCNMPQRRTI